MPCRRQNPSYAYYRHGMNHRLLPVSVPIAGHQRLRYPWHRGFGSGLCRAAIIGMRQLKSRRR